MEGSKTITLELTTGQLFEKMKSQSYILGESLKSNDQMIELAAKIQASDDDDNDLKDIVIDGSTKLGNLLSRVLGKTKYEWSLDGKKVTFTVNAVANFMDSQQGTLKDSMKSYLGCYTLRHWLNLIKPDECQRFDVMLKDLEEEMRQLGAQRDRPVRTSSDVSSSS